MSARPRIGELLVNAGLLSAEQLAHALAQQREQGASARRLGHLLVELGYVSETQLTRLLSQHLSVPWVSLSHIELSKQLLSLVPREVAEEYGVIPVYVRRERGAGDTLYLAMEDPTHEDALRQVTSAVGMPVKPMIASPSDVRAALKTAYDPEHRPASVPPRARRSVMPGPMAAPPRAASQRAEPTRLPPPPAAPRGEAVTAPVEPVAAEPVVVSAPAPGLALTLLDGTTLRIPAQRKREAEPAEPAAAAAVERSSTRELLLALRAVSHGARPEEVLGDTRIESVVAALISLLIKKQVFTEADFAEEWQRRG